MTTFSERIIENLYHSEFCDINIVEPEPGIREIRLIAFGKGDNKSTALANVILESALSTDHKVKLIKDLYGLDLYGSAREDRKLVDSVEAEKYIKELAAKARILWLNAEGKYLEFVDGALIEVT